MWTGPRERSEPHSQLIATALARAARALALVSVDPTHVVRFSFASPSPVVLGAVAPGQVLARAAVLVATPFDDPAATLELGTSAAPGLVFAAGEVDVRAANGTFDNDGLRPFGAPDVLLLTISPHASTQGDGIVLYQVAA